MTAEKREYEEFYTLCKSVESIFEREWKGAEEWEKQTKLEREKRAIMGFEDDMAYYRERIAELLRERFRDEGVPCPPWYKNAAEGIFAELYGMAGLSPWVYDEKEEYRNSSSAKLIGDRLYCLIDGKSRLQPQRISDERRQQLKRALLLATPKERIERGFHEVYMHNGIRITIYSGDRTKEGQDVIVFRKYVLRELTFEKLASLGTIPSEAVELFKTMVKIGFNVLFSGPVRSGKTAFMQTWQRYEDESLEGMAIATDPETPWHVIMPEAPIMQLVADGRDLEVIAKSLLRGDNDYVLLEEMRDAEAFKLALDITSAGTARSKATIHAGDAADIPYKMASAVISKYGGNLKSCISQVFRNFNYVLELYQSPENRGRKILRGISELRYDPAKDTVSVHRICAYDESSKRWMWKYDIGDDKRNMGKSMPKELERLESMLKLLEKRNPLTGDTVIYPQYYRNGEGKDCAN